MMNMIKLSGIDIMLHIEPPSGPSIYRNLDYPLMLNSVLCT